MRDRTPAGNQVPYSTLRIDWKAWFKKTLKIGLILLLAALTALPILNIAFIVATTGVNNQSNDLAYYLDLFHQVLSGTYEWQNYFRDTFIRGHFNGLAVLVQLGVARFTGWNIYVTLFFGIVLALLKLYFLGSAFVGSAKSRLNWLLWPLLAALVFSTSQISIYEYDFATVEMGLNQLGFVVGIWGMVRFPNRWLGIWLMALGGVVASWSWGGGPLVWPAFLLGLILFRFRRVFFAVWFAAGAIAALPYFYFLIIKPSPGDESPLISLFNFSIIAECLGWPFTQSFSLPMAYSRGVVGIILCVLGLALLGFRRIAKDRLQSAPALMLLVYSALNVYLISLFRDVIAPWYSSPFMLFWIGLLGLAHAIWVNREESPAKNRSWVRMANILALIWCFFAVGLLLYFYFTSNLTYRDKSFLLRNRSPSSAACLRHFATAPTYCEQTLFVRELGQFHLVSEFARLLKQHQLSVFAPHQVWTLQGDFILDHVQVQETKGIPDVFWSADLTGNPIPYSDFRHLNLFLHAPNSVSWTVALPAKVQRATFHSAVAISRSAPAEPVSDGVIFEVSLAENNEPEAVMFSQYLSSSRREWEPFEFSLTPYAGKTVTIRLASHMFGNLAHDWAMYRYPYIDLELAPENSSVPQAGTDPSNTDLNPSAPRPTPNDDLVALSPADLWQASNMMPISAEFGTLPVWGIGKHAALTYQPTLDLCLSDYSHLSLSLMVAPDIYPHLVETKYLLRVYYKTAGDTEFERYMNLPLLPDGEKRSYFYDLKLLELGQKARLTGLQLRPLIQGVSPEESWLKINEIRFIRKAGTSYCD